MLQWTSVVYSSGSSFSLELTTGVLPILTNLMQNASSGPWYCQKLALFSAQTTSEKKAPPQLTSVPSPLRPYWVLLCWHLSGTNLALVTITICSNWSKPMAVLSIIWKTQIGHMLVEETGQELRLLPFVPPIFVWITGTTYGSSALLVITPEQYQVWFKYTTQQKSHYRGSFYSCFGYL